jgi:hypothetical protein
VITETLRTSGIEKAKTLTEAEKRCKNIERNIRKQIRVVQPEK